MKPVEILGFASRKTKPLLNRKSSESAAVAAVAAAAAPRAF